MRQNRIVLALVAGVAMTGAGHASAQTEYVFVSVDPEGEVVIEAADGVPSQVYCVINAHCTTGAHTHDGPITQGFYYAIGNLAGAFTNTVVGHDGTTSTLGCVQEDNGLVCQSAGPAPAAGATFAHHCFGQSTPALTLCAVRFD